MKVAMVGTGYVGLVSGACFSEFGVDVVCVDKDESKIERLCQGDCPIYEPGLEDMVRGNVEAGRLSFSTETGAAVAAHRIDFVDEDDARGLGLCGLEELSHARSAHANEHLDKIGSAHGEERHLSLAGDCPGQKRLARARRAGYHRDRVGAHRF